MGKIKKVLPIFLVFMLASANAPKLRFTNHDFSCYSTDCTSEALIQRGKDAF